MLVLPSFKRYRCALAVLYRACETSVVCPQLSSVFVVARKVNLDAAARDVREWTHGRVWSTNLLKACS